MSGCSHHLSVRSVRSFIAARVEEKTPVATQRLLEGTAGINAVIFLVSLRSF